MKAELDRTGGVLRIRCPHCHEWTELPGFASVEIFICPRCQEPSEVADKESAESVKEEFRGSWVEGEF